MSRRISGAQALFLGLSVGAAGVAVGRADCPSTWLARGGQYWSLSYAPRAMTVWNDGRRDLLVLGGRFDAVGGVRAVSVAAWNGQGWSQLGDGLGVAAQNSSVESLVVFDGQLIASGNFSNSGSQTLRGVARWDGAGWRPMGTATVSARDFAILDGALIAGGSIRFPANPSVYYMCAVWDGAEWQPFGTPFAGEMFALAAHQGQVIASGRLTSSGGQPPFTVFWDGTAWSPLPGSDGSLFVDFEEYQGDLVATGTTVSVEGFPSAVVRRVGDAWDPLGPPLVETTTSLARFGNDLVVTGFSLENPEHPGRSAVVLRFDGTSWTATRSNSECCRADVAQEYAGRLVTAGPFIVTDIATGIGATDFDDWSALGPRTDHRVADLANLNGTIIAGGDFARIEGVAARGLAAWNGRAWREFAGGVPGSVRALRVEGDALIVAGQFNFTAPAVRNIGVLENGSWQQLGAGLSGPAAALTRYGGELIAAGEFLASGGQSVSFIARWDGAAWCPLGSGLSGPAAALEVYQGELYVGGFFGGAGGVLVQNLARWNGLQWAPVGVPGQPDGVSGGGTSSDGTGVYALAAYDGELFIGGTFSNVGPAASPYLARWNGAAWNPLLGTNGSVRALKVIDDVLLAGGRFDRIAAVEARGAAAWDGAAWTQIGGGLSTSIHDFEKRGNRLMAAGALVGDWSGGLAEVAHVVAEFGCAELIGDLNCDGVLTRISHCMHGKKPPSVR